MRMPKMKTLFFEGGLLVLGGSIALQAFGIYSAPLWVEGLGAAGLAVSGALHLFGK